MKKTILTFVLALSVTLLFLSCVFLIPFTYKVNLDKQSPADKNTTVTFNNSTENGHFQFKEWNGISIEETVHKNKMIKSNDIIIFTVPAGNNSFIFDVRYEFNSQHSSSAYTFEDIELRYNFEHGIEYKIEGFSKSLALGFMGIEFYLYLYDTKQKAPIREWMIGKKN